MCASRRNRARPARGNERLHLVERGDTIFSLSRAYEIGPKTIQRMNDLDARYTLCVGEFIVLPGRNRYPEFAPSTIEAVPVDAVEIESLQPL